MTLFRKYIYVFWPLKVKLHLYYVYFFKDRFGIKPSLCEKSPRKPADGCVQEVSDEMSRMKIRTAEKFVQKGKDSTVKRLC